MTSRICINARPFSQLKQRGVVLFLALIALLVMSLAAVALIRSVDTTTLIAGNLAFKQAATTSADAGIEAAISALSAMRDSAANSGKDVMMNTAHTFNITDLAARPGYFSYVDPALNLTDSATWNATNARKVTWDSVGVAKTDGSGVRAIDNSGNTIQYIIQRMCRNNNVAVKGASGADADCLFAAAAVDTGGQQIKQISDICEGAGCIFGGQTPQVRVTVRVTGPKNTSSYVQAFVY